MLIFLDTETTGLNPGKICQLSYLIINDNRIIGKNFFCKVDYIEPAASLVNGLSVEMLILLSGGRIFKDYYNEIANDFILAKESFSHNFSFDYCFLQNEFLSSGSLFKYNSSFCTMKKFTPFCKLLKKDGITYKYPKLSELCGFFNITDEEIADFTKSVFKTNSHKHDARFDASAVFLCCIEAQNRGYIDYPELREKENIINLGISK